MAEQSRKTKSGSPLKSQSGLGGQSGVESGVESEMALQIIDLLKDTQLSKSEIAHGLGKNKPTRYLNDLMKKLLGDGYVVFTIPEKPNSCLQKYSITEQGKELLQARGAEDDWY